MLAHFYIPAPGMILKYLTTTPERVTLYFQNFSFFIRLSFSNCHLTSLRIFSSSRPTVLTQYPFPQKCLPQYRFLSFKCLSKIFLAHLPFKKQLHRILNILTDYTTKCTWSSTTFMARISSFFHSHGWIRFSLTDFRYSSFKILYRYFGRHTIWYLHCQIACANLLKNGTRKGLADFDDSAALSMACGITIQLRHGWNDISIKLDQLPNLGLKIELIIYFSVNRRILLWEENQALKKLEKRSLS